MTDIMMKKLEEEGWCFDRVSHTLTVNDHGLYQADEEAWISDHPELVNTWMECVTEDPYPIFMPIVEKPNFPGPPWEEYRDEIREVVVVPGTKTINPGAFRECWNLKAVSLPDSLQCIGEEAFMDCECLTRVVLPEGLQEIECGAFNGCITLTELNIPAQVQWIGCDSFENCPRLLEINVDPANPFFVNDALGAVYTKDTNELLWEPPTELP